MKGIITITFDSYIKNNRYDIDIDKEYDFNFSVVTNMNKPFSKIYKDDLKINKDLKMILNSLDLEIFEEKLDLVKSYLEKKINIFDNVEYIQIYADYEQIVEYIERNPELKSKKIVLSDFLKLDEKSLQEVKKYFGKYSNIYLMTDGNWDPITVDEFEKTLIKINEMVDKIKRYDYSTLEQILYAYDLTRDRIYINEDACENKSASRDLTQVLLGDKIVCAGYANIFKAILIKLGIPVIICEIKCVYRNGIKHGKNLVYVKDDKYKMDGLYYFDTTFDRKRKEGDNSFLNVYKHFCKTRNQIESYFPGQFIDNTLEGLNESTFSRIEESYDPEKVYDTPYEARKVMNKISHLVDKDTFIPIYPRSLSKKEILERLNKYRSLLDSPISAGTFLKAFYNVRKNEYYKDPKKYPLSKEVLCNVILNSGFTFNCSKKELISLIILYGSDSIKNVCQLKIEEFLDQNELNETIEGIKLSRTLRNIYENKSFN